MRDLDYLKLLSKDFKNIRETASEIINLHAILELPKGTEYFFSDLHGEYESFIHLLRSASGVIKRKIYDLYGKEMSDEDILKLSNLIYFPKEKLKDRDYNNEKTYDEQREIIKHLITICKKLSQKYSKSKIRKMLPKEYAYIIEELIYSDFENEKKEKFYNDIFNHIIEINVSKDFITVLCEFIQKLAVDMLHIIGDIYDRGPRADFIMDELMNFGNVDIQWGNHDIEWMGAFLGNDALICSVVRGATRYNNFDVLEDGYGINIRPLSMFAEKAYEDDPCEFFQPKILDENKYDSVDPILASKMQKAMAIMQFKCEGALIKKHPEYQMNDRIMLERINYDNMTIDIGGKIYKLRDTSFPTVDKNDPLKLTKEEKEVLESLKNSFKHSKKLQEHINFLYTHGSMYKTINDNLLFHGCIPFNKDGTFLKHNPTGEEVYYSGKGLLDYFNDKIFQAYYEKEGTDYKNRCIDRMWYMWCGPKSPLFGKDTIRTFEIYFVEDKEVQKENFNVYYNYMNDERVCLNILHEFGLSDKGHIINGHVPVKEAKGESPVKGNGKLYVIDGGLSKAYQSKTGIAGYTLIYDSVHMTIAIHKPYQKDKDNTPEIREIETLTNDRIRVKDTDVGKEMNKQITDLTELLKVYRDGTIKESVG